MKKLIIFALALVCVFGMMGCDNTAEQLQTQFAEYYNLGTTKGIEVYMWQTANGEYRCGALSGTNRNKTNDEILNLAKNSATIEEMREILILPVKINAADFEIVDEDFARISEIFWKN